ncbi:hypothetical protein MTO96_008094 [Rhipicephalus appendiculatus]
MGPESAFGLFGRDVSARVLDLQTGHGFEPARGGSLLGPLLGVGLLSNSGGAHLVLEQFADLARSSLEALVAAHAELAALQLTDVLLQQLLRGLIQSLAAVPGRRPGSRGCVRKKICEPKVQLLLRCRWERELRRPPLRWELQRGSAERGPSQHRTRLRIRW